MTNSILLENVLKKFTLKVSSKTSSTLRNQDKNLLIALNKISFNVEKGEIFSIIGSNGSGKTTLLRIIAGIYQPDSGHVTVKGKLAPLLHIGTGFHPELVASENIVMYGLLLGMKKSIIKSKIDEIIKFAELDEFEYMKLKHYSAGMKVRLAFSAALQIDADILLIDEILAVGDLRFRQKCLESFSSFKDKTKSVVYTTHNMNFVSMADRALLLDHGNMIFVGKPEETIQKYKEILSRKS